MSVLILQQASSTDRPQDQSKNSKEKGRERVVTFSARETLEPILDWLEMIVYDTQPLIELFAQATPTGQYHVEIPEELLKAWLHLIMSLIQ